MKTGYFLHGMKPGTGRTSASIDTLAQSIFVDSGAVVGWYLGVAGLTRNLDWMIVAKLLP